MNTLRTESTVGCIVLNWNSGEFIARCLQSLVSSKGVGVEIIVIDNASADGSGKAIAMRFPSVTVVQLPENVGVAAGWNKGVEFFVQRGVDWLFLVNSDATVDSECLRSLLDTIHADPTIAAVTPRIMDGVKEGKVWFDGGRINIFGHPYHRNMGRPPEMSPQPFVEDFGSGCVCLIRLEAIEQLGPFDEAFFAYVEDTEFCIRAKRNGWQIVHQPSALALHFPSGSVKKNTGKWFRDYYVTRNALMLGRRTMRGFRWFMFLIYFLVASFFGPVVYFLATAQVRRAGAIMLGAMDFVRGRTGKRYG